MLRKNRCESVVAAAPPPQTREKEFVKSLRPSVWLTECFPLKTEELLPLLDILANKVKAVRRMRELLTTKFPPGTFPVKVGDKLDSGRCVRGGSRAEARSSARWGWVTAVESGSSALQYLGLDGEKSSVNFDDLKVNLIITDYSMPVMTGYELLKNLKTSSALRKIPVVIMSSENIMTRIDSCLEEGVEDFLVKPVKLSDVKRLKDYILKGEGNNKENAMDKRKINDDPSSVQPTRKDEEDPSSSDQDNNKKQL